MQKRLKKIGLALVAVGLSIALLLTGAIPVCEARPDEKVVKIAAQAVLSGAMADTGVPAYTGLFDCVKYTNDTGGLKFLNEKGDIDSVKLDCLWEDTRYEIPRSIQAAKRFRQAGAVVEFNISGSPYVCTPDVWINHVPVVDVSTVSPGTDIKPPWFFTSAPTWADLTALSVLWARD